MTARVLLALLLAAAPTGVSMVPHDGGPPATVEVSSPVSRWAAVPRGQPRYTWPTGVEVTVLRPFEPPPVPWGTGHRGVDLALAAGSPVFAAADGTVAFAGTVVDRPLVSIDHAGGIRTTHEPVVPTVAEGQPVRRGDLIGILEAGHCDDGCLHFGARTGHASYIDPLLLLENSVVRLHPW